MTYFGIIIDIFGIIVLNKTSFFEFKKCLSPCASRFNILPLIDYSLSLKIIYFSIPQCKQNSNLCSYVSDGQCVSIFVDVVVGTSQ